MKQSTIRAHVHYCILYLYVTNIDPIRVSLNNSNSMPINDRAYRINKVDIVSRIRNGKLTLTIEING